MNSRTETPLLRGSPACQKSLAGVYRTGLANSHGAACLLRYLIYTSPDIGEQRGLFWDIPHRWIQFLQAERFPPYVLLFRLGQSRDWTEPGRRRGACVRTSADRLVTMGVKDGSGNGILAS